MPQIKRYRVTQTREVEVTANDEVDATRIAAAAFNNGQDSRAGAIDKPEDLWGNTTSFIDVICIRTEKDI